VETGAIYNGRRYTKASPVEQLRIVALRSRRSDSGCLEYQGPLNRKGYGRQFNQLVHRIAWVATHGDIPDGLFVCHRCDNPRCLEPTHLFLGTNTDNMRDCARKRRLFHQQHPELAVRGEQVGTARLSNSQVLQIAKLLSNRTKEYQEIASLFGVSKDCIHDIAYGRSWAHLTGIQKRPRSPRAPRRVGSTLAEQQAANRSTKRAA
jgi:hypothetical protein